MWHHLAGGSLAQHPDRCEVRGQYSLEICQRKLADRRPVVDAGVGDQDIEAAVPSGDVSHSVFRRGGVADVESQCLAGQALCLQFGNPRCQCGTVPRVKHHMGTRPRQ